jgi:catechol 2,3-dioxygenase-like lactoylglutathione lyase family enzyme
VEKKLDPIDHIAVAVDDISSAVEWYTSQFACNVAYQDATWAMLEFRNMKMALVLPEQHAAHVAFQADDLPRFGTVASHRDGVRYVYTQDPFDNTVEIVERDDE